ncbi:hypothetical protein D3C79_644750 [compost metagenome]
MHQPGIQRQPIDERLEGGAGGADRLHHVEVAVASQVAVLGAAHVGAHRHGPVVHQQERRRGLLREAADITLHPGLQPALQIPVYGGVHQGARLTAGGEARKQRRLHGGEMAPRQHRLDASLSPDALGPGPLLDQPQHHLVAGGARPLGVAIRAVTARRLGQHRQQGGLGMAEFGRTLAQIGKAGRLHPLQVAAEGGPVEVDGEQGALVIVPLQLQRPRHLAQLARHTAVIGLDQPGHLHGEGRAAGDRPPIAQPLPDPAHHGYRIDPGVLPEVAILVAEQRLYIAGGNLRQGHRVAPHPAGVGEGSQRSPLHVEHHPRIGGIQRWRREEAIQRQQQQQQTAQAAAGDPQPTGPA